jgi:bifunctional enzyme CysN/CysC
MGAIVLVDALSNNTVGAGMIVRALGDRDATAGPGHKSQLTAADRRARFGHGAALILFVGAPSEAQRSLAHRMEAELFALGCAATVIDVPALQDGTRSPALLADVAGQCLQAGLITVLSTAPAHPGDRRQLLERLGHHAMLTITLDPAAKAALDLSGIDAEQALEQVVERLARDGVLVSPSPVSK